MEKAERNGTTIIANEPHPTKELLELNSASTTDCGSFGASHSDKETIPLTYTMDDKCYAPKESMDGIEPYYSTIHNSQGATLVKGESIQMKMNDADTLTQQEAILHNGATQNKRESISTQENEAYTHTPQIDTLRNDCYSATPAKGESITTTENDAYTFNPPKNTLATREFIAINGK